MKNIILIGMPGSGKTTIGKLLANKLNLDFVDSDNYIESQEHTSLQQIIDLKGDEEFLKVEERRIFEIELKNHVLATGGSVVYLDKLMIYLKSKGTVIFLDTPLEIIEKRIETEIRKRGILGLKTKSFKQLFSERNVLYRKYADTIIDCSKKQLAEIVKEIIQKIT